VNGATGAVVQKIMLPGASGGNGAALDAIRGQLYVANQLTNNISRVDLVSGRLMGNIPVGRQPNGIAVDDATGIVYIANSDSNTITLLEGITARWLAQVAGDGEPSFVVLDRDRGRFYVTNCLGATVTVHQLTTGALQAKIATGGGPYGIAFDPLRSRLYTANRDGRSLTVIDLRTDRVLIKDMLLPCAPHQAAVNPTSGHLFVVCAETQQLHIYHQDTLAWLAALPIGRGAGGGLAVDQASGRVYVSNAEDNTITVIQDS